MVVNVYEGCDCATLNTSITAQLLLNTAIYYCMAVIIITEHIAIAAWLQLLSRLLLNTAIIA